MVWGFHLSPGSIVWYWPVYSQDILFQIVDLRCLRHIHHPQHHFSITIHLFFFLAVRSASAEGGMLLHLFLDKFTETGGYTTSTPNRMDCLWTIKWEVEVDQNIKPGYHSLKTVPTSYHEICYQIILESGINIVYCLFQFFLWEVTV